MRAAVLMAALLLLWGTSGCAARDIAETLPADGDAFSPDGGHDAGPPLPDGAAALPDGGAAQDGGGVEDGGLVDGGEPDGGASGDAGPLNDAGASDDGGQPEDGGPGDGGAAFPDGGPPLPCETGGLAAEAEPNNSPRQANPLTAGQSIVGVTSPTTDEDWFVLDVCGESLLTTELRWQVPVSQLPDGGQAAAFGLRVDVLAADGTTLLNWQQRRQATPGPASAVVVAYAERPGPIYFRVTEVGASEESPPLRYELRVTPSPVPDADQEPNGNLGPAGSSAAAVPLFEGIPSSGYLASTRDEDWFRLTLPGLRIVDVFLSDAPATGTPLRYRLRFLDRDATTELARAQARAPGPGQSVSLHLAAQAPTAGDYFVVVSDQGDAADAMRPYQLFYELRSVPDANQEPNDTPAQATPIPLGHPLQGYIAVPSDEDWFSVFSQEAKVLRAELQVAAGLRSPVDYQLTVFGPDGYTRLAQGTDYDGQYGDIQVIVLARLFPHTEPSYVVVSDWGKDDGDSTTPYTLEVTLVDIPDAAIEPNDEPAFATLLVSGIPVMGHIAWQGDRDFFSIEAAAGQTIAAALSSGLTAVQYRLSIRDPQGVTRLADTFDVDGRTLPNELGVQVTVPETSRYYVTVEDLGGDDADLAMPYLLTVSLSGP
jgi:hypothetical protein